MNKHIQRGLIAVSILGVVGSASAATGDPDISAVTAAGASVALVGAAVFAVKVGSKLYKWITGAL